MDSDTRRQKQQALMAELVERKVRVRARQLYDTRGQVDGHALQDWVQAEREVVEKSILAVVYRRLHMGNQAGNAASNPASESSTQDSSARENRV